MVTRNKLGEWEEGADADWLQADSLKRLAALTGQKANTPAVCKSNVVAYCTEEVERQGHDVAALDGIERVGWMLNAWSQAILWETVGMRPIVGRAVVLGKMVEPEKNHHGIRSVEVRAGSHRCPPAIEVDDRLVALFELGDTLSPLAFYRAFEEIHPFVDGNGRTGKVLLNWKNGTLLDSIFPPANFWGASIRNP